MSLFMNLPFLAPAMRANQISPISDMLLFLWLATAAHILLAQTQK